MRRFAFLLFALAATAPGAAELPRTPAPAGAEVYFISPKDGETVSGEFVVRFGLKGMGIAPAGIKADKTGHHHLIVDAPVPPPGQTIATDDHHRHFGLGQTETTLKLAPGKHTLQLVLGDYLHVPHDPPVVSAIINVTVE